MSPTRILKWGLPLLIAGLIISVAVQARRARRVNPFAELRDAVASDPPLSPGHAGLARDGRSACSYCHVAKAAPPPMFMRWGGVGWERSAPAVVPDTAVCLSCHDGALASMASVHGPQSHPIGVDYALAARKSPERFNDIAALGEVRLEDGKVGCLSCHAVHKPSDASSRRTVIESSCQTCHRL